MKFSIRPQIARRSMLATLVRHAVFAGNTLWSEPARRALLEVLRVSARHRARHEHVSSDLACRLLRLRASAGACRSRVCTTTGSCPAAAIVRDSGVPRCLDDGLHASVRYKCYHASATESAVVAAMLGMHRTLRHLPAGFSAATLS